MRERSVATTEIRRAAQRPAPTRRALSRYLSLSENNPLYGWLYLLPYAIIFVLFLAYPIVQGFWISFTQWDLVNPSRFVGLDNYRALLSDDLFSKSLANTLVFAAMNAPLIVVVPLGLAILVNRPILGRTIFRSAFTAPIMISVSSVGLLWGWFLNPVFGIVNAYAQALGLPPQNWLAQPGWAMLAVVITTLWWSTGWNLVLYLAGLQEIPEHLYEAARIDGAGGWALFRHVTLPGLRPTTLFVSVTSVIGSLRVFGQVYVLTGGGPYDSTRTVVQHIYQNGFEYFKMGYASSVAWVLFVIILAFVLVEFRFMKGRVDQ